MRWIFYIAFLLLPQQVATDTPQPAAAPAEVERESFVPTEKVPAGDAISFPVDI